MKTLLCISILLSASIVCAQQQAVKYVKTTYLNSSDSTLYSTQLFSAIEKDLPWFNKETYYDRDTGIPTSIVIYATNYMDSTYFDLRLSYGRSEWSELGVYHKMTHYSGEQQIQEEVELQMKNDGTIIKAQIEVYADSIKGSMVYQLPAQAIQHYKNLAIHQLNNTNSLNFEETTRPFTHYGSFMGRSYTKSHETEDSIVTYTMLERIENDQRIEDTIAIDKRACPKIKTTTFPPASMPVLKKQNNRENLRKFKAKPPYYLDPKNTKRIAHGYNYEKRLLKRDAPSYVEIFYE